MKKEWLSKKEEFEIVDVRAITTNFLPGFLKKLRVWPFAVVYV